MSFAQVNFEECKRSRSGNIDAWPKTHCNRTSACLGFINNRKQKLVPCQATGVSYWSATNVKALTELELEEPEFNEEESSDTEKIISEFDMLDLTPDVPAYVI